MKSLFSADGIRLAPNEITSEFSETLGNAIAQWINGNPRYKKRLVIATDTRESCYSLKATISAQLLNNGIIPIDAGIMPTAGLSYILAKNRLYDAGVMITASHNPFEENGIKIFEKSGKKINTRQEKIIEELYLSSHNQTFLNKPLLTQNYEDRTLKTQYINSLIDTFVYIDEKKIKLPIIVDCANGASSEIILSVLDRLRIPYIPQNYSPNGHNINHNCGSEYYRLNPKKFVKHLLDYNSSLGVAFDGDADRIIFIDKNGRVYDGDDLLAVIAVYLKQKNILNKDSVVITQMSNTALIEYLQSYDIVVEKVKNGDKYISKKLIKNNFSLGGEQIGHIIFHSDEFHVTGDGIRTFLLVISILNELNINELSDILTDFIKRPQINASVLLQKKTSIKVSNIKEIKEYIKFIRKSTPDLLNLECRPASTEPVYRIMLEAKTTSILDLSKHAIKLGNLIQNHLDADNKMIIIRDCVKGGLVNLNHNDF